MSRRTLPPHYSSIHFWLKSYYGKAAKCENKKCSSVSVKRFEWALKKGCKYEKERNNFIQLCKSCHVKYDMTEKTKEKIRDALKILFKGGNNPRARKIICGRSLVIYDTVEQAAKSVGIKRSTLSMMLTGINRNKTTLKYYDYDKN